MSFDVQNNCSSRLCNQPAEGSGPFCGLPLCRQHLIKDIRTVNKKGKKMIQKLEAVTDAGSRPALRAEQISLSVELQEVNDAFDALEAQVQIWRQRTVSLIQAAHDSVSGRLRDAADADDCTKKMSSACDSGDWKNVMEQIVSQRHWIDEACERAAEFDEARSSFFSRHKDLVNSDFSNSSDDTTGSKNFGKFSIRSVGDVSSGVLYVQSLMDKHFTDLIHQCRLSEESKSTDSSLSRSICKSVATIENLLGLPNYLAACTNTAGFAADSSDRLIRADSSRDTSFKPLPESCIFVTFYTSNDDENIVDYIFVTSISGDIRLQYRFQVDFQWTEDIRGLHCDNQRQILCVAQYGLLTIADLAGSVKRTILPENSAADEFLFCGITANEDKLFVLRNNGSVVAFCKDKFESICVISLTAMGSDCVSGFSILGKRLYLVDLKRNSIHVFCSSSGQLLSSYPTARTNLECNWLPFGLAIDTRCLMFISNQEVSEPTKGQTVVAMDYFGSVLQTLGIQDQAGDGEDFFDSPGDLLLIELADCQRLVVSDERNKRLRVFQLV